MEGVHLLHDDLVITTENEEKHVEVVAKVLEIIQESGLTVNAQKCKFWKETISFWGMLFDGNGMRPDPAKIDALEKLRRPENKKDLISFLCMMRNNTMFIPNFSKRSACLQNLTKNNIRLYGHPSTRNVLTNC